MPGLGQVALQVLASDLPGLSIHLRQGEDPAAAAVHYLTHDATNSQFWFRQNGDEWRISRSRDGVAFFQGPVIDMPGALTLPADLPLQARIDTLLSNMCPGKAQRFLRHERTDRRHKSTYRERHYVAVGYDRALRALRSGAKVIAVTGPAGVGKTACSQETFPRAVEEYARDQAALPVIVCSRVSSGSDTAVDAVGHLKEEFAAAFKPFLVDSTLEFDVDEVPPENRFATAVGIVDEMPADANDVDLQMYLEQFKADTPWAKDHVLVMAGTSLSLHRRLPRSNTTVGLVSKVQLAEWHEAHVVDLVGNVGAAQHSAAEQAGRFLAQIALGVTPDFVPSCDREEVEALLKNRRCANLGHLMRHNTRTCRFIADALLLSATLLMRQLRRFSEESLITLKPSQGHTPTNIAAEIKTVTGLSPVGFICHHLSNLEIDATTIIKNCVSLFFQNNGLSMSSQGNFLGVAKAILAVVNKAQRVASEADWQSFRAAHKFAEAAVSYGLLVLEFDLGPGRVSSPVALGPTVVGLYVALMALGIVVPGRTLREVSFERIAALAVVTRFHGDVVASGRAVRQAGVDEFPCNTKHFNRRSLPENALVFADPASCSTARFNCTHMQMRSLRAEGAACVLDLCAELTKAQMFEPAAVPRRMVFVCEHECVMLEQLRTRDSGCQQGRLNMSDQVGCVRLSSATKIPTASGNGVFLTALAQLPAEPEVAVYVMYGKELEHWWPLLSRVSLAKVPAPISAPERQKRSRS